MVETFWLIVVAGAFAMAAVYVAVKERKGDDS